MRSIIQSVIALLLLSYPASATTYTYTGLPLTEQPFLAGICNGGICPTIPGLTGSVTFNFDTTNFTGTLSLVAGDTASLVEPGTNFSYPVPPNPNPLAPFVEQVSGLFTLTNGAITDWMFLGGYSNTQYCPAGPGCIPPSGGGSFPFLDSYGFWNGSFETDFTNSGGGTWTVAAVPEPSTWAMLLIGFAGGFASYRRSQKLRTPSRDIHNV
jgi:hypothetical protein